MPLHKRVIGSQGKAPQQSADKATAVKNRRRDIYKQQSTDKKEALLLQRRTRRQESNNQNFLPGCLTPPLNTQVRLTGQRGITIRELPSEPQTGNTSCDDTSTAMQGKGKTIISPFCIFEAGSTSATTVIHHNPNSRSATHRGSSSLATQQHDLKATTGKTKGYRKGHVRMDDHGLEHHHVLMRRRDDNQGEDGGDTITPRPRDRLRC